MDLKEFLLNAFKNFSASQLLTGEDKCPLEWCTQGWDSFSVWSLNQY